MWIPPAVGIAAWGLILWITPQPERPKPEPVKTGLAHVQPIGSIIELVDLAPVHGIVKDLIWIEPWLYVARSLNGLELYRWEIGNSIQMEQAWTDGEFNPISMEYDGVYLYTADRFRGLTTLELQTTMRPKLLHEEQVPGIATAVRLREGKLLLAHGGGGVSLFGLQNPAHPKLETRFSIVDYSKQADWAGEHLYLADGRDGGMRVFHYTGDQLHPLRNFTTSSYCDDAVVQGSFLFNQNRELGVIIYDLTDPANPQSISQVYKPDDASMAMQIHGDWLLVLYHKAGLALYDIRDRQNPQLIESAAFGRRAQTMIWEGDSVFVSDHDAGIAVYRIHLPDQ
ncbi:hypothetical protein JXA32_15360 [Candidatus Sumerlaeota bacterium]|nr:hypothetical protein [Candidatus Sumerlaeota bacterium]